MKTYTQTHNYIYRFLNNISNTVGETITEYHWREACELMKRMEDEELVNTPEYENEEAYKKPQYYSEIEAIQFMNQQGIVCDHYQDYDQYFEQYFEYIDDDKYKMIEDNNQW